MLMDPALKESILGDLRLANAFFLEHRSDLGLQFLRIAQERQRQAFP